MDNKPSEVELGGEAKHNVGEQVGELVDVVQGGRLSTRQLQHQPQMQGDTVDLHKEGDYSTGYIELSVQGIQETPNHLRTRQT